METEEALLSRKDIERIAKSVPEVYLVNFVSVHSEFSGCNEDDPRVFRVVIYANVNGLCVRRQIAALSTISEYYTEYDLVHKVRAALGLEYLEHGPKQGDSSEKA